MRVSDVMVTDVVAFRPEDSIADVTSKLVERGISGGPVVDDEGRVVGVVTDTDLIVQDVALHVPTVLTIFGAVIELPSSKRRFEDDLRKQLAATVSEVMDREPVTCGPDDDVNDAATILHERDLSRLPVVDGDGRLVGIIARHDVLRAIVAERGGGGAA